MFSRLIQVKLGTKLFGGFAAVLVLLCLVAVVGYTGLSEMENRMQLGERVNGLVQLIDIASLNERNYVLHPTSENEKKVVAAVEKLVAESKAITEQYSGLIDPAAMIQVAKQAENYLSVFNDYIKVESRKNMTRELMVEAAKQVMQLTEHLSVNQNQEITASREENKKMLTRALSRAREINLMVVRVMQTDNMRARLMLLYDEDLAFEWEDEAGLTVTLAQDFLKKSITETEKEAARAFIAEYKTYIAMGKAFLEKYPKAVAAGQVVDQDARESEAEKVDEAANKALERLDLNRRDEMVALEASQSAADRFIADNIKLANLAEAVMVRFLRCRRLEAVFMFSNDQAQLLSAITELDQAISSAKKLKMTLKDQASKNAVQKMVISLNRYKADLNGFAEMINQQEASEQAMQASARAAQAACRQAMEAQKAVLAQSNQFNNTLMVSATIISILLGMLLAWLITRGVTKPIGKAAELAETIRSGDLSKRLDLDSDDEVGHLATALDAMADVLEGRAELAHSIARGELFHEVNLASEADTLGHALKLMTENLHNMVAQLKENASQVAMGAEQIKTASQIISNGATQQAASLEEINSSLTEIASQTKVNADSASKADRLSDESSDSASRGDKQMRRMVGAMDDIKNSSADIAKIIKVIDGIAFQTNLLALNAAVEAARAGQHGKGFAVVAEEVRNLAGRSAKAAQETAELIEGSVKQVEEGGTIATATADALAKITEGIAEVSSLATEIAQSSDQQAEAIMQINQGLRQVEEVSQQSTANTEQTAAASDQLSAQAMELMDMLTHFKLEISDLLKAQDARPEEAEQPEPGDGEEEEALALADAEGPEQDRSEFWSQMENQDSRSQA